MFRPSLKYVNLGPSRWQRCNVFNTTDTKQVVWCSSVKHQQKVKLETDATNKTWTDDPDIECPSVVQMIKSCIRSTLGHILRLWFRRTFTIPKDSVSDIEWKKGYLRCARYKNKHILKGIYKQKVIFWEILIKLTLLEFYSILLHVFF